MKIFETLYVCRTGKTEQFYTLYIERVIVNGCFTNNVCSFIQNLSLDLNDAKKKSELIKKERLLNFKHLEAYSCNIEFSESKRKEYCTLKSFNLEWKKTAKGFITDPNSEFWDSWREKKDILKEAGFRVFKDERLKIFKVFFYNCSNEEMAKKLELLNPENITISGNYVGELNEKISKPMVCSMVYEREGYYGPKKHIILIDKQGNQFKTVYSGKKQTPEKDKECFITGTVKDHTVLNSIKTTILTRCSFK